MTPEERANRIYEASSLGWRRQVVDIMSSLHKIYHWSMPVLLAAEAAVLLFLAVWPLWCGVLAFVVAVNLFSWLNERVAYLAWRRWNRLRNEEEDGR
jgi:hypothetical protein